MTRHLRIDDLTDLVVPEQPALSPDASQIAYVLRTTDVEGDRTLRSLWRVSASGGEPQQLTRGDADSTPVWSPDGTQLAFLRAKDGPAQLWLLPVGGGEPEQVTTLPLGAGTPWWSPDGTRIAFSAPVDIAGLDDEKRSHTPIVTERLDYQADGAGWLRTIRKHLHLLDVDTKKCRQATEGDWHASDPSWSPDGTKLAYSAGTAADIDLNPTAPAYVLDATDEKATPQLAGLAEGIAGPVSWTTDSLLIVGNLTGPVGHAGLLRLSLDTGEVVNLAESLDRNVMPGGPAYPGALPCLIDDGSTVLFAIRERGCSHLYSVPLAGGTPQHVLGQAGQNVSSLTVSGNTAALVLTTQTSYGEVVTLNLASGEVTARTAYGEKLAEVEHFLREEREFTVSDGTVVAGYLMRDPSASGSQPLLLDIHGGPHNAWNACPTSTTSTTRSSSHAAGASC